MMDQRDQRNQDHNRSSIINNCKEDNSPRKPPAASGGDRTKRDEWSEGAVTTLLDAYESKWILRNRAKLKGLDWEDVARRVSSRANNTKSPKTQTQCKNKIESMKKRYRSESSTMDHQQQCSSTWPLYSRLDHLLRGTSSVLPAGVATMSLPLTTAPLPPVLPLALQVEPAKNPAMVLVESEPVPLPVPVSPPPAPPLVTEMDNSPQSNNCLHDMVKEDKVMMADEVKLSSADKSSDKRDILDTESSTSTPALYNDDDDHDDDSGTEASKRTTKNTSKMKKNVETQNNRKDKRRRRGEVDNIAKSIRWLAEAVVRSEQARMDTIRELERMRVEAEVKRGEMELKRTEIVANTQLEIAKLFAASARSSSAGAAGGGVKRNNDSSLGIGRSS